MSRYALRFKKNSKESYTTFYGSWYECRDFLEDLLTKTNVKCWIIRLEPIS